MVGPLSDLIHEHRRAPCPGNRGSEWAPSLRATGCQRFRTASNLGPKPTGLQQRYQDLYEKFAGAWRVSDATSLFDYEAGLTTGDFTIDSWPMESPRSCTAPPQPGGPAATAPPAPLTLAEAERLCSAVTAPDREANCVQDVMATGEPGFAQTYKLTEQIGRKAAPTAPVLGLPEDNSVDLAETVRFTWSRASGSGGGPVTYRHCVWSADQLYDFNKCAAVAKQSDRGILYAVLAALIGLLLFLALLFTGLKHKRVLLILVAIAILPAVLVTFYFGRTSVVSTTVAQLEPGKVYFWKVIAEVDRGGTVESQTRRFTIK